MSITIRLLTYNILQGGRGREAELLKIIQTQRPDLVILQELNSPALLEKLAKVLGMNFFYAPANTQLIVQGRKLRLGGRNLGLLSRFPVSKAASYRPFPIRRTMLEAVIEFAPGQTLALYGVHLKANLGLAAEAWRCWEIGSILRRIEQSPVQACLVAGDFNTLGPSDRVLAEKFPLIMKIGLALRFGKTPRWAIPRLLRSGFLDCYRSLHPTEDGFTLPTPAPNTRLDYIFASPAMQPALRKCEVIQNPPEVHRASDHYPLLADFELD